MNRPLSWLLALGAVVVAAWFGLGWVQAKDTGQAQALVSASRLSPHAAARARSLLSSASTLNPDRTIDILRGQLAEDVHQGGRAVQILEAVTRAEPQNLAAWRQLTITAYDVGDNRVAKRALTVLTHLVRVPK